MLGFLERYRHLVLLVAVLLVQILFLGFQIKAENNARLIRVWAIAGISPIQRLIDGVTDTAGSLLRGYFLLHGVHEENERLLNEIEDLRVRLQATEARAREADRLANLLQLKETYRSSPLEAAEVIGTGAAGGVQTVFINRGADAEFAPNLPVITPDGVVGKIITVHPTTAEVLLITDEKSGVGAVVEDSRVHGVLKGNGTLTCELAYVPNEEEVRVGARLLTSGQDQVFPKGLPLGIITALERGSRETGEYFWRIEVTPAARLTRLEKVLVLAGPPASLRPSFPVEPGPGVVTPRAEEE